MEKSKVIVWITSPLYARNILNKANEYAISHDYDIVAVSLQAPIGDDWAQRARDLEILEKAAREIGAQLHVEFTPNTLKSAYDAIETCKPVAMFTGMPAEVSKSSVFLENIRQMANGSTLYMVDRNGAVLTYN